MAETKIVLTAEDRTAQALASLRNGLSGIENRVGSLRGVFAGLVPALSFAGAATFIKSINDGVDALNDLKDASGASIANISALEDIAARTGTGLDVVGSSLVKFNQLLNAATPGSTQAAALKAIGLEAEALQQLDPAEALRRTAVALAGFADDGNKARLAQELFGRSIQEVAPFLNDLAEKTELVGTVTDEQTAAAEKFNKQLAELQKNATDVGRSITSVLVPALNQVFSDVRSLGAKSSLASAASEVVNLKKELDGLQQQRTSPLFPTALIDSRIDDVTSRLEAAKARFRELDAQVTGFGQKTAQAPQSTDPKPVVVFNPEEDKARDAANKKLLAENAKARATDVAGWVRYAEDKVQADFAATKQIADNQIKLNEQLADSRATMMRQWFDTIDQEQEDAIAAGRELIDAAAEDAESLKKLGTDLGFTFSSAFEDAVVGGKEFSQVLQGIADDILRITLRRNVTEKFANAISGIDFGSLFGGAGAGAADTTYAGYFANGGIMSAAGPLPLRTYASGGVASSPQLAIFGEGSMNEAYVPLPDGRRIPVNLNGGSGSNVVVNVIEAPGQGGQQSTRQQGGTTIVDVMVDRVKSAVADDIARGSGAVSASMERTYGLSRSPGTY